MNEFWILILVSFFATNSLDKAESVKLDEKPHKIIDEIFGEGWWDNDKSKEWDKLTLEQIGPDSTDQNTLLTESDHSNNAKNSEEQNEIIKEITSNAEDEQKRKIVAKFHTMKDEFKQKGKSDKESVQIEIKIAKHLKVNRTKIYKWKKEFGLNRRNPKNEQKNLVKKFDQMKAELKRDGFKSSYKKINETVANELGLGFRTIYKWKRKLGQTKKNKYPYSEQKEMMKRYYEIKNKNPKISDKDIAKMLNIGTDTLVRWKRQFKRQQLHPNSVDGLSVEENAAENVQEIGNTTNFPGGGAD